MYTIYWKKDNAREFDERFFEGMDDEKVVSTLLDLHNEGVDVFAYSGKRTLELNGNYYRRELPTLTSKRFNELWKGF